MKSLNKVKVGVFLRNVNTRHIVEVLLVSENSFTGAPQGKFWGSGETHEYSLASIETCESWEQVEYTPCETEVAVTSYGGAGLKTKNVELANISPDCAEFAANILCAEPSRDLNAYTDGINALRDKYTTYELYSTDAVALTEDGTEVQRLFTKVRVNGKECKTSLYRL